MTKQDVLKLLESDEDKMLATKDDEVTTIANDFIRAQKEKDKTDEQILKSVKKLSRKFGDKEQLKQIQNRVKLLLGYPTEDQGDKVDYTRLSPDDVADYSTGAYGSPNEEDLSCYICGKVFENQGRLQAHVEDHY